MADTENNQATKGTKPKNTKKRTAAQKRTSRKKTNKKKAGAIKKTVKKNNTPTPIADSIILDEQSKIAKAKSLKDKLSELLNNKNNIKIDASKVEKIDTSVLQLLTAFSLQAQRQSIEIAWQQPSPTFTTAADLLDLSQHLIITPSAAPSSEDKVEINMPVEAQVFPGHFRVQWSETMHMLDLSANQLDVTIQEGNESMELLMNSFSSLTDELDNLEKAASQQTKDSALQKVILERCNKTKETINQVVIGLQFYDRFTQRIHNVRESIAVLAALIDDPERQNIPEEWITLRNSLKSKYSKEQQKTIFHALMQGAEIDEVFEFFDED